MKPIRTPKSDVTLTLAGGTEDNELPAQRVLVYDADLGETEKDARLAFETIWLPDEAEAGRLEAGAGILLRVWAIKDEDGQPTQPPVAIEVTGAVVPERELVQRGIVDNALGRLYGALRERAIRALLDAQREGVTADDLVDTGGEVNPEAIGFPQAGTFVDMWLEAIKEATSAAFSPDAADPSQNGSQN